MSIVARCLVLAAANTVIALSSQELHNRYGEPNLERFMARPGISLTVEYGSDHLACQVLIEPPQPLIHTEEPIPLMSSDAVTEILEEIVPSNIRGKETGTSVSAMGCNESQIVEYEKVSIMRSTHNGLR